MPEPNLQINIAGHWLTLEFILGNISMSTIWPGGSDELSFTLPVQSYRRFTGGEIVTVYFGPVPVWCGYLLEPDPSQDQLTAQGLWRLGDNYPDLTAAGAATASPNTSIDQAIIRGLPWTRPVSIAVSSDIDITQGPVSVGDILDNWSDNLGVRWGVDAFGQVFQTADPTTPDYQTLPAQGGLGYALDNYASTLICRYLDSATSTFKTLAAVTDSVAEALHGHVEAVVDLTGRGAITAANATTYATNLLKLGRSTPQWTSDIEVSYGELLNMGGTPVALETVAAGHMVRVWGGVELPQRQNGSMYVDILIGQTKLSGGTLVLQPLQRATRSYQDFVTASLAKKRHVDAPDR